MVIGITFQFFINMEIERYTLATGESVFVGLSRKFGSLSPLWFILSTFLPWMWPGIILSSAILLSSLINVNSTFITVTLLLLIGLLLSISKIVYKTQEQFQKYLIILGVPFIFALCLIFVKPIHLNDLFRGLAGQGNGFFLLPLTLPLFTFLGALAYSGAGGNLNLAQSFYIREKGYGMGKYSGKISGILHGQETDVSLEGNTFPHNKDNFILFNRWWKLINLEHLIIFWLTGLLSMLMLALLSYALLNSNQVKDSSINFLITQALIIGQRTIPLLGSLFLMVASLMLFSTQLSLFDATSRIMSENLVILNQKVFKASSLGKIFFVFLWLQITVAIFITLLGFKEPFLLVNISAVLNAFSMFIYSGLILYLNFSSLPKPIHPSKFRFAIISLAIIFFLILSLFTIKKIFIT